jgi:hypothetical protein
MRINKALFWITVGGVSILAPFALQMAADNLPIDGLKRFVAYIYKERQS